MTEKIIRRNVDRFRVIVDLVGGHVGQDSKGVIRYYDDQTPPSEEVIATELKRLEDEYDAQEYARKRALEYPSSTELAVAMYDTDDKAAIDAKRAAVKAKWPKDNSGPVE